MVADCGRDVLDVTPGNSGETEVTVLGAEARDSRQSGEPGPDVPVLYEKTRRCCGWVSWQTTPKRATSLRDCSRLGHGSICQCSNNKSNSWSCFQDSQCRPNHPQIPFLVTTVLLLSFLTKISVKHVKLLTEQLRPLRSVLDIWIVRVPEQAPWRPRKPCLSSSPPESPGTCSESWGLDWGESCHAPVRTSVCGHHRHVRQDLSQAGILQQRTDCTRVVRWQHSVHFILSWTPCDARDKFLGATFSKISFKLWKLFIGIGTFPVRFTELDALSSSSKNSEQPWLS